MHRTDSLYCNQHALFYHAVIISSISFALLLVGSISIWNKHNYSIK